MISKQETQPRKRPGETELLVKILTPDSSVCACFIEVVKGREKSFAHETGYFCKNASDRSRSQGSLRTRVPYAFMVSADFEWWALLAMPALVVLALLAVLVSLGGIRLLSLRW